jgi:hypothetical protein
MTGHDLSLAPVRPGHSPSVSPFSGRMLTGPLNRHSENLVYHPSPPSFADVGLTSPSPNTRQSMMPNVGISQQRTLQYTTATYPDGSSSKQADKGKPI